MNEKLYEEESIDLEFKKLFDNIENIKSNIDIYSIIVDEQMLIKKE